MPSLAKVLGPTPGSVKNSRDKQPWEEQLAMAEMWTAAVGGQIIVEEPECNP